MVGRAVEAQVDAKGDRRPRRVLLATVKADLRNLPLASREAWHGMISAAPPLPTLFAGFDLSLSKIFCDCSLLASGALISTVVLWVRGSGQVRIWVSGVLDTAGEGGRLR